MQAFHESRRAMGCIRSKPVHPLTPFASLLYILAFTTLAGCGSHPRLMPPPNLFAKTELSPFAVVPEADRDNTIQLIYLTDRKRQDKKDGTTWYGRERSHTLAFGTCPVRIGQDLTWEELCEKSLSEKRGKDLRIYIGEPKEAGRYPLPPDVFQPEVRMRRIPREEVEALEEEAAGELRDLVRRRIRETGGDGRVFLYVHGVRTDFEGSMLILPQLYHFLGRPGVPIVYSWPAGRGGIRGYVADRESGEFSIYHLKRAVTDILEMPEVTSLDVLAYSRGADLVLTAMREVYLQRKAIGLDRHENSKVSDVILTAPDIDAGVFSQRIMAEGAYLMPERITIYLSSKDRALRISQWINQSAWRLGIANLDSIDPKRIEMLQDFPEISFVYAKVKTSFKGHDYFYTNPAVSSDVILVLRDGLPPGEENGRPLLEPAPSLWEIYDEYPGEDLNLWESLWDPGD